MLVGKSDAVTKRFDPLAVWLPTFFVACKLFDMLQCVGVAVFSTTEREREKEKERENERKREREKERKRETERDVRKSKNS